MGVWMSRPNTTQESPSLPHTLDFKADSPQSNLKLGDMACSLNQLDCGISTFCLPGLD